MGLVVDNFAGGGGASTALKRVFGHVDIAINHNPKALAMHRANHPETRHLCESVWDVDPAAVCEGRPIDALWLSPDCTHFSKAKGGKPRKKEIRALADVVFKWIDLPRWQRPKALYLENVEEWQTWGDLDDDGYPIKEREGELFRAWIANVEARGYDVELRVSRVCEFGVPTIRKRLLVIARLDGRPIVWPKPTHFDPNKTPPAMRVGLAPQRTAADCIDWSIPCPSIFTRKRPLVENSARRVARGTWRYVVENPRPFIVPICHSGSGDRVHPIDEPVRTITTAKRGELALVSPTIINTRNGERRGQAPRCRDIRAPYPTVTAVGSQGALVAAFLAQYNNHKGVTPSDGRRADAPLSTITMRGTQQQLVTAHLCHHHGSATNGGNGDLRQPLKTVTSGGGSACSHASLVTAFLLKYYGTAIGASLHEPMHTVTHLARFGLVTVTIDGETFYIADIGMRMLTPRELFRAQGFPDDYVIDLEHEGRRLTKSDQIGMCGNSVCPGWAEAHIRANNPRDPIADMAAAA